MLRLPLALAVALIGCYAFRERATTVYQLSGCVRVHDLLMSFTDLPMSFTSERLATARLTARCAPMIRINAV